MRLHKAHLPLDPDLEGGQRPVHESLELRLGGVPGPGGAGVGRGVGLGGLLCLRHSGARGLLSLLGRAELLRRLLLLALKGLKLLQGSVASSKPRSLLHFAHNTYSNHNDDDLPL